MKFRNITLHNFMRYKGKNRIDFSCEKEKNVTIVLGDNTVGKTTLAQAFRFCLYGELMVERGKEEKDYCLLNTDVIEEMDSNSKGVVSIELEVESEESRYTFYREIVYNREPPTLKIKEVYKKFLIRMGTLGNPKEYDVPVEEEKLKELVNELFPRNLSHYFLFDGEKWSDLRIGGVRENIKESVHTLTGLSSIEKAMWHLSDIGSTSVIKKIKSKIAGTGAMYDHLDRDVQRNDHCIVELQEKVKVIDTNIYNCEKKVTEIEDFLFENKSIELMQNTLKQLTRALALSEENYTTKYKILVDNFSFHAYQKVAQPMIEAAKKMLEDANLERRDIPYIRQKTIDYLLERKECICGTQISKDSKEYRTLLEQRSFLPPADISSLLGEFERKASAWGESANYFMKTLEEESEEVKEQVIFHENIKNEYETLNRNLDKDTNFAEKREELRKYRDQIQRLNSEKGQYLGRIDQYQKHTEMLEKEKLTFEAKTQENAKWKDRITLATLVYDKLKKEFNSKEQKVFCDLNLKIQKNFSKMFNAKDKTIELDKHYNISLYYKNGSSRREEKNLSEGEKIARNFAFIVSIMDYSMQRKSEGDKQVETLPVVLDGPFSKLGDENIQLISNILPSISEQIIIFMLKKDWQYTGLDNYVGAKYYIEKDPEEAFARIQKDETI